MDDPAPLIAAVAAKMIPMSRIDDAVRKIMVLKFRLGLFDNAMVIAQDADSILRNPQSIAAAEAAEAAERAAQVLLKNENKILPLRKGLRIWSRGIDTRAIAAMGLVPVTQLANAEVALVRASTPHESLHPFHFFGMRQNEGRLDFRVGDASFDDVMMASKKMPVVVVVDMDRPAILTGLIEHVKGLVGVFGASDAAVLDVLTGNATPKAGLPLELPRSMDAVTQQDAAAPDDSQVPLFRAGAKLRLP